MVSKVTVNQLQLKEVSQTIPDSLAANAGMGNATQIESQLIHLILSYIDKGKKWSPENSKIRTRRKKFDMKTLHEAWSPRKWKASSRAV